METFEEKVKKWESIEDKDEATSYYFKEIFPDVLEHFLEEGKKRIDKNYDYIISIVGFSPEPIILFNKFFNPKKHYFICSNETEKTIDTVVDFLGLKSSQYEKFKVNPTEISDIYKTIKDIVIKNNLSDVLVDITGGKKSMAGAASLAGSMLYADIGYVDYLKYNEQKRKPEPKTEYPVILENPLRYFGDIEIDRAKTLFDNYQFEQAEEILTQLEDKINEVGEVRKYKLLSEIYGSWNKFEIDKAIEKFEELFQKEKDYVIKLEPTLKEKLKLHYETLRKIKEALLGQKQDYLAYKPLNFFFTAERYATVKKYDIAVFLMYRTIESVSQARLFELGLDTSNATDEWYSQNNITKENFNAVSKELFQSSYYERGLPRKVALMDGYIILSIKKDYVLKGMKLNEILDVTNLRNESVYAHGVKPLTNEEFNKIRKVAKTLLTNYLLRGEKQTYDPVEKYRVEFEFPKLK